MDPTPIPQIVQDMVIDNYSNDTKTLRITALVNHAWKRQTYRHLFSRLVVHASTFLSGQFIVDDEGSVVQQNIPTEDKPAITFEQALTVIPPSFDPCVKQLVLTSATHKQIIQSAIQGIELTRPRLKACIVKQYLHRFPGIDSLIIEDVDWQDCLQDARCGCLDTMPKRVYRMMIFRHITHVTATSDATMLLQTASRITDLAVERVHHGDETQYQPQGYVAVNTFTLGFPQRPWPIVIPDLGEAILEALSFTGMSWLVTDYVYDLIHAHHDTLQRISFDLRWMPDGECKRVSGTNLVYSPRG